MPTISAPPLAPADLGELVVHVGGFVAALLEKRALLNLAQLVMEGGDGLPGIAFDQVLDGGVEVVLQGVRDDDVLAGLLEAVAQGIEAPVLAREPPGGAPISASPSVTIAPVARRCGIGRSANIAGRCATS
ncbi:hypothetical protein ACQ5SK_35710 [Bradyrhizobium japonicum]